MDLVESTVLFDQSIGRLVQRLNVLLYVSRLIPRQLSTCLHLAVYVSHAFFEVLQLLQHHWFLRLDDLLIHIVVEICDLLQTKSFLVVPLALLCGIDDLLGHFSLESQLCQLSSLSDQQNEAI